MSKHVDLQNADLRKFINNNNVLEMYDNIELCEKLGIATPIKLRIQNYEENDIRVYLNQNAT